MASTVLYVILLFLNLINVSLHLAGLVLIRLSARRIIQHIYLLNLSLSVAIINMAELIRVIFTLSSTSSNSTTFRNIRVYAHTFAFTGIRFFYFMDMIIITLDRLLLNLLTLRYKKVWNRRRARRLVNVTWLVGICTSCATSVAQHLHWFEWQNVFQKFVYPILDLLFIMLAIATYIFIYRKTMRKRQMVRRPVLSQVPAFLKQVRKYSTATEEAATSCSSGGCGEEGDDGLATVFKVGTRRTIDGKRDNNKMANHIHLKSHERRNNNNYSNKNSNNRARFKANSSTILHNSVFYIPFLLINSFLIFMVAPDLVILFISNSNHRQIYSQDEEQSELAYVSCGISYAMCNLLDGCIYVFFHNDVRKMFLYHVSRLRRCGGQMVNISR